MSFKEYRRKKGAFIMQKNMTALLGQIALGEDSVLVLKTVSFSGEKVADPHRDAMADELAAMANTVAGVIVLGVDDITREIQGIPRDKLDLVESWLRSICNDLVDPPLTVLSANWQSRIIEAQIK